MTYAVKEIYLTLQGEGANSGRAAVFCRFAGCNLWSGREEDRPGATCGFCDTDFRGTDGQGGGRFETPQALASAVLSRWPERVGRPFVVFTGGEPALQLDRALLDALHGDGAILAVETNGTLALPAGLDWICVSPKAGTELLVTKGDELKLVHPQAGIEPDDLLGLEFDHYFLQPMDGPDLNRSLSACVEHCLRDPRWRLSLQAHKAIGLP